MGSQASYASLETFQSIGFLSAPKRLQSHPKTFCSRHPKKGTSMTTEHPPKTPSPRTGIFALLRGLLRVKGSGLSKISLKQLRPFFFTPVKLSLFSLPALLLASLAFTAAPALAAAPEAPGVVTVESITESTANLRGVLNPGTLAEPPQEGTYEFIYNETVAGQRCEEGFKSKRGLSFGNAGADGMW